MPAGRSGSGGGVEGHRVAESLQFPNVVTDSALGVGAGGVVLRSEVEEVSVLVGEQGPYDHENGPADGDDGRCLPRRRAIRRHLSPRKVFVRLAPTAASPRTQAR